MFDGLVILIIVVFAPDDGNLIWNLLVMNEDAGLVLSELTLHILFYVLVILIISFLHYSIVTFFLSSLVV